MSLPDPAMLPGGLCLRTISAADFSPTQQLALLSLRPRCELSKAVLAKLRHSTARANWRDFADLAELRFCLRKANGFHAVTPLGNIIALRIAQELAKEFGVALYRAPSRHCFERTIYTPQSTW